MKYLPFVISSLVCPPAGSDLKGRIQSDPVGFIWIQPDSQMGSFGKNAREKAALPAFKFG